MDEREELHLRPMRDAQDYLLADIGKVRRKADAVGLAVVKRGDAFWLIDEFALNVDDLKAHDLRPSDVHNAPWLRSLCPIGEGAENGVRLAEIAEWLKANNGRDRLGWLAHNAGLVKTVRR